MSTTAKAYIALVIASGMILLMLAAGSWSSSTSLRQVATYLDLAFLASVWGDVTILAKSAAQSTMIKGE